MNSGVKGGATRVSIPSSVKKTIEDIKEITSKNHSEDDIYAMLKECAMDPNETTQRLLLLDTFHEVKRRRDRKKENQTKEPEDQKWKPGTQSRSNRVGRGNYINRHASQDADGGRSESIIKENAPSFSGETVNAKVFRAASLEIKKNGSSPNESGKPNEPLPASSLDGSSNNSGSLDTKNTTANELLQLGNSGDELFSSASGSYLSSSGSQDSSTVALQPEQGIKHATLQLPDDNMPGRKSTPSNTSPTKIKIFKLPHEMPNYTLGIGESRQLESLPAVGRPSSNYNDRSQVIGQQKEWKPKSSHSNTAVSAVSVEPQPELKTTLPAIASEDSTLELEKKLKDTNLSERKHVVIPNHLQVPEVKKLGFCFGSFDAGFELHMSEGVVKGDFGKTSVLSQPSIPNDEPLKELAFRSESTKLEVEDTDKEYSDHPETTVKPPSTNFERNEPLLEAAQESHQHASHHIPSSYNIGLPPIVSSQVSPLESSESQARDATRVPGFIMQQPFDPASYYAQFYRSGLLDNDGRISPILPAGAVNNYNGNNTAIPSQTSQTHPELQGNEQLVTQAAGVMRSSIPATQQNLPIFRHPSGVHLPHYPPNFIPYGPYFSPFYVPPPAIHQFLGNGMFPPQPQSGSLYPSAPGTSSKYSVAQFKQGSVTGNSTQVGLPGSFGTYGLSMAGFSSTSPSPTVTSSSSDNVAAPYIKENNAYIGVQQNDGSGVWYATPTADVGNVQASTFYNPSQGQMPFNPTGPGHGAYTAMFHPAQGVAPAANIHPILQQSQPITSHVDMVGQTANAYQQQQTNWPSSY